MVTCSVYSPNCTGDNVYELYMVVSDALHVNSKTVS